MLSESATDFAEGRRAQWQDHIPSLPPVAVSPKMTYYTDGIAVNSVTFGAAISTRLLAANLNYVIFLKLFIFFKVAKRDWVKSNPGSSVQVDACTTNRLPVFSARVWIRLGGNKNSLLLKTHFRFWIKDLQSTNNPGSIFAVWQQPMICGIPPHASQNKADNSLPHTRACGPRQGIPLAQ